MPHYSTMKLLPEEFVREFHEIFGAPINVKPSQNLTALRQKLIDEEVMELNEEFTKVFQTGVITPNFVKEMADLQYVLSGLAVSFGIDLNRAVEKVHESNMSKLVDGKFLLREDGKILKGPNYFEPDMTDLVPTYD